MQSSFSFSMSAFVGMTIVCVLGTCLLPRLAQACSFPSPTAHTIDPKEAELDDSVPAKVTWFRISEIRRGTGPDCNLFGSCKSTSCDDVGRISFDIEAPYDDRSSANEIGYVFEVLDGEAPHGLRLGTLEDPIRTRDGSVRFTWIDGSTDDQEPIDFSVIVYAMDRGGNVGEPSDILHVTHPGSASGCSVGQDQGNWFWTMMILFIVRFRRRSDHDFDGLAISHPSNQ